MKLRIRSAALGLCVVLTGTALTAPVGAAPPPTYTPVAAIPGTAGLFNHSSATAPDGTDVVVWIGSSPGGSQYDAKVRRAGSQKWATVPPRVVNKPGIQDEVLTAVGSRDFAMAWVEYADGAPTVWHSTLDTRARSWSKPVRVFNHPDYDFAGPRIASTGDGTVVVGGYAAPKVPSFPPNYRSVVAVQKPNGSWKQSFLTPADQHSGVRSVSASPRGHLLVTSILGYNLAEMTVHAATRGPAKSDPWRTQTVSAIGDSQSVTGAIGRNGDAALFWSSPANGPTLLRMATAKVTAGPAAWTTREVSPPGGGTDGKQVVVAPDGDVTLAWISSTGLKSRHLSGGVLGGLQTLSPVDRLVGPGTMAMRPDGRVALLYGLYTAGPTTAAGLNLTTLNNGVPAPAVPLSDAAAGAHDLFRLGVDASSRGNVVYARGGPPSGTDLAWLGQNFVRPDVMTSATSGKSLRKAKMKKVRAGVLRCQSGLWVEARTIKHAWFRAGKKIKGAKKPKYRLVARDKGKKLSCKVTGKDDAGRSTSVKSRPRKVG